MHETAYRCYPAAKRYVTVRLWVFVVMLLLDIPGLLVAFLILFGA